MMNDLNLDYTKEECEEEAKVFMNRYQIYGDEFWKRMAEKMVDISKSDEKMKEYSRQIKEEYTHLKKIFSETK